MNNLSKILDGGSIKISKSKDKKKKKSPLSEKYKRLLKTGETKIKKK